MKIEELMKNLEYYKAVREVIDMLLRNAPRGFGIDVGLVNQAAVETNKRLSSAKNNG
jgi:hypothetical protein